MRIPPLGALIFVAWMLTPVFAIGASRPSEGTEWAVLGGNAEAQHYSAIKQINEANVSTLGLAWFSNLPTPDGTVGNPLVADGVVYQSAALSRVFVTDVRTGNLLWKYAPELAYKHQDMVGLWANRINRGLALWKDKVIVGTGDCRLIALDRKTGRMIWEATSCDPAESNGITGAPRVGGGKVFIGNTCGESGATRGFVDAFDAETGAHKWRFYTVPSAVSSENKSPLMRKAFASWGTNGLKNTQGCASPRDAITYDPVLNLLYFGTDSPAPSWNPRDRAPDRGDELFTAAIIAVNAETGAYAWHYSTTPNNAWDFEATMPIMVADLAIDGRTRRVVMQAPKNGFFYVWDAKTGQLLRASNFAHVNWASHIDLKTGRPVELADAKYYDKPNHQAIVFPGPQGAHNWQAMSYNPATGLVYIPVTEIPTLMKLLPADTSGTTNPIGGTVYDDLLFAFHDPQYRDQLYGELVAWDPIANHARWRARQLLPINGGTLSTAGNLVFEGTGDGKFVAYDATDGKERWSWQGDGAIQSAPTTVNVDGEQYILVASGNAASAASTVYATELGTTDKSRGPSRLLAFKLGGSAQLPARVPQAPFQEPPRPRPPAELVKRGSLMYYMNGCVGCHGEDAVAAGGSIPDLRRMSDATHRLLKHIVVGGIYKPVGMPQFPQVNDDVLVAIEAYVTNEAWIAYDEQERRKKAAH